MLKMHDNLWGKTSIVHGNCTLPGELSELHIMVSYTNG